MLAVEQLIDISIRLQQISAQMAWLQQQVWQLTMMQGVGYRPSPPQGPTARDASAEERRSYVDQGSCRGCGLCVRVAPRTFRMDPQTGRAVALPEPRDPPSTIQMAVARCPVGAIHYR